MSTSDYEVHMDRDSFNSLWRGDDTESEVFPFGEDMGEIDRIVEEELGSPRRRRARRNRQVR